MSRFKTYLFLLLLALFFSGCAKYVEPLEVADLTQITQDPNFYVKNIDPKNIAQDDFKDRYFKIWQSGIRESKSDIAWGFAAHSSKNSYGINLKPLDDAFFTKLKDNANFDDFKSINKKAISVKYANLRVFPTSKPLFRNPTLAGEGFPFDYLQNSSVAPNEPLFISHFSKDREFVYAFSSYASGWIKSDDFAYVSDEEEKEILELPKLSILKDDVSLLDDSGNFLFKLRVGMHLPLLSQNESDYEVLVFISSQDNSVIKTKAHISFDVAKAGIATFSKQNIAQVTKELLDDKYGWGGMFEQRDCSSMMRDYFSSFGYFLPRNSAAQARVGEVISLKGLSDEQKLQLIKQKAVPFQTLLYKKGHIVLYVGEFEGEPIVFHNTWGVRTFRDGIAGRFVVGRALFSTLHIGSEHRYADKNATLLKTIESLNILH